MASAWGDGLDAAPWPRRVISSPTVVISVFFFGFFFLAEILDAGASRGGRCFGLSYYYCLFDQPLGPVCVEQPSASIFSHSSVSSVGS